MKEHGVRIHCAAACMCGDSTLHEALLLAVAGGAALVKPRRAWLHERRAATRGFYLADHSLTQPLSRVKCTVL